MTNIQYCIARANKQLADEGKTAFPMTEDSLPVMPPAPLKQLCRDLQDKRLIIPEPSRTKRTWALRALERQAWMRSRQEKELAQLNSRQFEETRPDIQAENMRIDQIERQREAQLLREAESEIRRRQKRKE